jgi:hypothetical protein
MIYGKKVIKSVSDLKTAPDYQISGQQFDFEIIFYLAYNVAFNYNICIPP